MDFCLVTSQDNLRNIFEDNFPKWVMAISMYCRKTQVRSSMLQSLTAEVPESVEFGGKLNTSPGLHQHMSTCIAVLHTAKN